MGQNRETGAKSIKLSNILQLKRKLLLFLSQIGSSLFKNCTFVHIFIHSVQEGSLVGRNRNVEQKLEKVANDNRFSPSKTSKFRNKNGEPKTDLGMLYLEL